MPLQFSFPDGKKETIESEKMLNLLAHLQSEELTCGSLCGGHGECGGDRVQINLIHKHYFSPPTHAEKRLLGEQKLSQGWRLACQCFPSVSNNELIEIIEIIVEKRTRDAKEFDPYS